MDPQAVNDAIELWAAHAGQHGPPSPPVDPEAAPGPVSDDPAVQDALATLRKVYTHLAMGGSGLPDGVPYFQYRSHLAHLEGLEGDTGVRVVPNGMLLSGTDFDGEAFKVDVGERLTMRVGRSVLDATNIDDADVVIVDCSAMLSNMRLAGGAVLHATVLVGADITVDGPADLRGSDLRRATITAFGPLDLDGAVADADTTLTVTHRRITSEDQVITERADAELGFSRQPNDDGSWTYQRA